MSRLVVVSNRVADISRATQSGGLAVALADALTERGGVWFGWDGEPQADSSSEAILENIGNVAKISCAITEQDYDEYYVGYSNSVLWPLFHYRLDLVDFQHDFFLGYCRVNALFAARLAPFLRTDDVIWVHDYHLIPFATYLRDLGFSQRMGFFLHIPFPPAEMLSASPNHRELADALLRYDVIGFQTSTDLGNFMRYIEEHTDGRVLDNGRIETGGRTIQAGRFPIGIDVDAFREMAHNASDDIQIDKLRREILGRQQIIGVDRLDYSKGLPSRMEAYGRLLLNNPGLEKSVTFLQIAPPTRQDVDAYSDIRVELERLAGSINGQFGDFNWIPINYIRRSVPRQTLAGLYAASQVGFVSPLRDGMNLVAKEYVAAQDDDNPGVLVLSQFAGAAEEMQEALMVNPYDVDDMAVKLLEALTMPLEERQARQSALLAKIRQYDVKAWMGDFLGYLEQRRDA